MISAAMIKENMEVLGSDGVHVGTVDHIEGAGEVRLASDDPDARGGHYFIPLSWVDACGDEGPPQPVERRRQGAVDIALTVAAAAAQRRTTARRASSFRTRAHIPSSSMGRARREPASIRPGCLCRQWNGGVMVAPTMIKEHMEVVGSDDVHVGTVDHMEGANEVKLTKGAATPARSTISFRSPGSIMSTTRSTSSNRAPRPRRAGRRTKRQLIDARLSPQPFPFWLRACAFAK